MGVSISGWTRGAVAMVVGLSILAGAGDAQAKQPKKYQVTGKVLEVGDDVIVVQKDDEKWEIAKDAATKVTGTLKVGAKVTIEYRMVAATAEVKEEKPAAPADKPKK